MENKNGVKLGEGVADKAKESINENLSELFTVFLDVVFSYAKDNLKEAPQKLEKLLSSPKIKQEIVVQWSNLLFNKGLIPKGYNGLSDELLISNFHQTGYLDGLYAGYVIAMMSLVDNKADKELILSVRDDMRPNLIRNPYSSRDKFFNKYKDETYSWIEKLRKTQENDI